MVSNALNNYVENIKKSDIKNIKTLLAESLVFLALIASFLFLFLYLPTTKVYSKIAFITWPFDGEQVYLLLPLSILVTVLFLILHLYVTTTKISLLDYLGLSAIILMISTFVIWGVDLVYSNIFPNENATIFLRIMVVLSIYLSRFFILNILKQKVDRFKVLTWKEMAQASILPTSIIAIGTVSFYPLFTLFVFSIIATAPVWLSEFLSKKTAKIYELIPNDNVRRFLRYILAVLIILIILYNFTIIEAEAAGSLRSAAKELTKAIGTGSVVAVAYDSVIGPRVDAILYPPVQGVSITIETPEYKMQCRRPTLKANYSDISARARTYDCTMVHKILNREVPVSLGIEDIKNGKATSSVQRPTTEPWK